MLLQQIFSPLQGQPGRGQLTGDRAAQGQAPSSARGTSAPPEVPVTGASVPIPIATQRLVLSPDGRVIYDGPSGVTASVAPVEAAP